MAVRIAKLEGTHAAVLLRQGLWAAEGNRRHASRAKAGIGSVHVRYDNGEMLEPEIGAPAACRVWGPWALNSGDAEEYALRASCTLNAKGNAGRAWLR